MRERWDIAVVGAGASGLMAARCAGLLGKKKDRELSVILLEGNPKPGKKLLATGNGRCNLTNLALSQQHYHGDREALPPFLERYSVKRLTRELEEMGILTVADDQGRVYPRNLQATAVLQALWFGCEEAGVNLRSGDPVERAEPDSQGFLLHMRSGENILAERCILAVGGMASPRHSCGSFGEKLCKDLGHSFLPCRPALAPILCESQMLSALKGMRCRCEAALLEEGRLVAKERGEVIFASKALSGICVFNLSSLLSPEGKKHSEISLDLVEDLAEEEVFAYLKKLCRRHPERACRELFGGLINLKVGREVVKSLEIDGNRPLSSLSKEELRLAAQRVKDLRFMVQGVAPFEQAQVTAGGVPLCEVELRTMESKRQKGLYLAGELLNVNGDCGGYNLHWAFLSGLCAGENAAASFLERERGETEYAEAF